jgi:hypothetical protein
LVFATDFRPFEWSLLSTKGNTLRMMAAGVAPGRGELARLVTLESAK